MREQNIWAPSFFKKAPSPRRTSCHFLPLGLLCRAFSKTFFVLLLPFVFPPTFSLSVGSLLRFDCRFFRHTGCSFQLSSFCRSVAPFGRTASFVVSSCQLLLSAVSFFAAQPLLSAGPLSCFDASAASFSCLSSVAQPLLSDVRRSFVFSSTPSGALIASFGLLLDVSWLAASLGRPPSSSRVAAPFGGSFFFFFCLRRDKSAAPLPLLVALSAGRFFRPVRSLLVVRSRQTCLLSLLLLSMLICCSHPPSPCLTILFRSSFLVGIIQV